MLALSLLSVIACGDDSSSDDEDSGNEGEKADASKADNTGESAKVDAGDKPVDVDAGKPIDPGPPITLAEALKTEGVNGTQTRADQLFPVACANTQACQKNATCTLRYQSEFERSVNAGFDVACLDAKLDGFACFASEPNCKNFKTTCGAIVAKSHEICDHDAGTTP